MIKSVSIDSIKPAPYNPRRIDEDDFASLCDSVSRLGIIVPVIVNRKNGTIIAGHQRTKAAKAIGMGEVPALFADNVSLADEVKFNQIHNGTDFDKGLTAWVKPRNETGFTKIPVSENTAVCEVKAVVSEVCGLIVRYGNVLSCVMTKSGEVFKSPAYADACRVLGIEANAYVVSDDDASFAKSAFCTSYGVFSYEHLEKTTWVQGLAQLSRRTEKTRADGTKSKRTCKSRLYERLVIPDIEKGMRILDFGAGKGLYASTLRENGHDIISLEFYHNNMTSINVSAGVRDIERLISSLETWGRFDAVVCDSVLNSVDSPDAERAVVGACSAMLKPGGTLYISGRPKESVDKMMNFKKYGSVKNCFYFLDADGFTATFRRGNFYYQKFHTEDQVRDLIAENGFSLAKYSNDGNGWRCKLVKEEESVNADFGIRFEFSLPYPGGRYEYADRMAEALEKAKAIDGLG